MCPLATAAATSAPAHRRANGTPRPGGRGVWRSWGADANRRPSGCEPDERPLLRPATAHATPDRPGRRVNGFRFAVPDTCRRTAHPPRRPGRPADVEGVPEAPVAPVRKEDHLVAVREPAHPHDRAPRDLRAVAAGWQNEAGTRSDAGKDGATASQGQVRKTGSGRITSDGPNPIAPG